MACFLVSGGEAIVVTAVRAAVKKSEIATGVVDAVYELARLYEQGLGIGQDLDKALALYREAAEYGSEAAAAALERLNASKGGF